jgi:NTP pyrophosphatase (non-canonical NTP hydrolase)
MNPEWPNPNSFNPPMIHREQEIIQWGIDRNILGSTGEGTPKGQWKKTMEECIELRDAIGDTHMGEIRDAIGDIIVTLIMQAQLWGLTMEECIEQGWSQIKDRKGRMVNGIFVKEI